MTVLNLQVYKCFSSFLKTAESKRDKKAQQATENVVELSIV
jgi:hypothetical protein